MSLTIVQIGTNTGIDHVRDFVKTLRDPNVLLVEPFSVHNKSIHSAYAPNKIRLENIAIVPDGRNEVSLYYSEFDGPNSLLAMTNSHHRATKTFQVASVVPNHVLKHYPLTRLKHINVPACTLNSLFNAHGLLRIDYLFLDIEGIDIECLKSIDFSAYDIRHLQIEHLHLDRNELHSFMASKGYIASKGMDRDGYDTMFTKY